MCSISLFSQGTVIGDKVKKQRLRSTNDQVQGRAMKVWPSWFSDIAFIWNYAESLIWWRYCETKFHCVLLYMKRFVRHQNWSNFLIKSQYDKPLHYYYAHIIQCVFVCFQVMIHLLVNICFLNKCNTEERWYLFFNKQRAQKIGSRKEQWTPIISL